MQDIPEDKNRPVEQHDAWRALHQHFSVVERTHMRDLFAQQPDRFEQFSLEAAGLFLDYSKNRINRETLSLLCRLAESVDLAGNIEAMFSVRGVSREQLRFVPEEHGGSVAGNLVVIDRDFETGEPIEIDCTRFGSGAYTVPSNVEHLEFRTKAKFILAIETGGIFQRLQSHKFWQSANCFLIRPTSLA